MNRTGFPIKLSLFAFLLTIGQLLSVFLALNSALNDSRIVFKEHIPLIQVSASVLRLIELEDKEIDSIIMQKKNKDVEIIEDYRLAIGEGADQITSVHFARNSKDAIMNYFQNLSASEHKLIESIRNKQWEVAKSHKPEFEEARIQFRAQIQDLVESILVEQQSFQDRSMTKHRMLMVFSLLCLIAAAVTWFYVFKRFRTNMQEKVKAEQQLELERTKTIQAAKLTSLGEMAAGIAHEINNPLTVIVSTVEVIQKKIQMGKLENEYLDKSLGKISSTALRIVRIIKSMKTFARNGTNDPMEESVIGGIITETTDFSSARFKNSGVELTFNSYDPAHRIFCRSHQIQQVLVNLLNNAFDAVSKLENKWVKVEFTSVGDFDYFRVIDSGQGIRADIVEKLMQPFFTTKDPGKGTGLGLSVSREIAQAHGGDLKYCMVEGHTCFELSFKSVAKYESESSIKAVS